MRFQDRLLKAYLALKRTRAFKATIQTLTQAFALCAVTHRPDGREHILGVARYDRVLGTDAAEVAVAVVDEFQRRGVGRGLLRLLADVARELAPFGGPLTGELACYRIYRTADGRHLTLAALEPRFWARLVELVGRPDLLDRAADGHAELTALFASRPLAGWLALFEGQDVAAGPVRTLEEAGLPALEGRPPTLGEHTDAWRRELGLAAA